MPKKFNDNQLAKRALSAAALIPVSALVIWYGSWPFLVFIALCAGISYHEWGQLALRTAHRIPYLMAGLLYVSIAFYCCFLIRDQFSALSALLFVAMIWASDSNAYLLGKVVGGPKMACTISPNKTWAGLLGAVSGPGALCVLYLLVIANTMSAAITVGLITGAVIGVVGQAGDLVVSYLKRQAGAKDTGQLIPGHGGLLDRVDAMMLCAPVFLLILKSYTDVFIP